MVDWTRQITSVPGLPCQVNGIDHYPGKMR
jgi:hypothetical protein